MPISISRKTRALVAAALAAGLVGGGAYLHTRAYSAASANLSGVRAALEAQVASNQSLATAIDSKVDLAALRRELDTQLPSQAQIGGVLEELSACLAELNIGGQELVTMPVTTGARYTRIPVKLHFRGTNPQTQAVLEHLRKSPRLLRIDRLKVEAAGDGGPPEVDIDFSAFARPMEDPWAATPTSD